MTNPELLKELESLRNEFFELEEKYQKLFKETKANSRFGGIFIFEDGSQKFIPFMQDIKSIMDDNNERPIEFKINFNQTMMSEWLHECKTALKKEQKKERLLPDGKRRK